MQVIPAVDVLDGSVVRLRQGRFDDVTTYASDPVAVARSWADEGADLVHIVDLNGARNGDPDRELWMRLSAAGVRFQIGGGIRTAAVAADALDGGAERVVLGTAAVWDPDIPGALVEKYGSGRVVAALDVRDGRATGSGWEERGRPVAEVCRVLVDLGVEWILATGIERDGMMTGPDTELLARIRELAPSLQLIASGGVSDLADLLGLRDCGYEAVVIGRALYEGRFTLGDAILAGAG